MLRFTVYLVSDGEVVHDYLPVFPNETDIFSTRLTGVTPKTLFNLWFIWQSPSDFFFSSDHRDLHFPMLILIPFALHAWSRDVKYSNLSTVFAMTTTSSIKSLSIPSLLSLHTDLLVRWNWCGDWTYPCLNPDVTVRGRHTLILYLTALVVVNYSLPAWWICRNIVLKMK